MAGDQPQMVLVVDRREAEIDFGPAADTLHAGSEDRSGDQCADQTDDDERSGEAAHRVRHQGGPLAVRVESAGDAVGFDRTVALDNEYRVVSESDATPSRMMRHEHDIGPA
jgi:hypothetical protein